MITSDTGATETPQTPTAAVADARPGGRIMRNVVALYGVQAGRKLIPLVSIPYLARVLGPAGWGTVAFVGALAEFVVILIEFGFNISATREVARNRECPEVCGRVLAGVLGAQAILGAGGIVLALAVSRFVPLAVDHPALLAAGLVYAIAQGFAPLWFFQGLERMQLSAALELTGKLAALCAVFAFIHSPADGWKVLAFQALAPALTTVVGLILAYRTFPFFMPAWPLIRPALVMGWPMFLFRSAESLYGVGNAFLLGLFAPPAVVGYFASAEKISKAAFGLLNPIREAIFPRLSHLAANGGEEAAGPLARKTAAIMLAGGAALGAGILIFAPVATRLLLGDAFEPAVTVLRIFSLIPVLLSVTYSIGFQWLLPFGRDRAVNQIIVSAGLINLALSFLLARKYQHTGMAWTVVISEAFVAVAMTIAVFRMFNILGTRHVEEDA